MCIRDSAGTQPEGNLCRVPDVLQNSQKCRVLWCNCHRTHRSIGYCGTAVTEVTEVLCRVKTEGNYPRYRSVGTLQNLSVQNYAFLSFLVGFGQKEVYVWKIERPRKSGVCGEELNRWSHGKERGQGRV